MKILNGILAFIFILFAAVQVNDPDAIGWIIIYGAIALVCGLAMMGKYNGFVILGGILACLAGSIYYMGGLIELITDHNFSDLASEMKAGASYIEEARESLGLLLGAATLIFQYLQMRKNQPSE